MGNEKKVCYGKDNYEFKAEDLGIKRRGGFIIAHVDMDCFFCSVEEKYNSKLKGKPVIVGGSSGRGVVSASNYEARAFGVYSAMSGVKAKELCPRGNFLPVNMKLYREESRKVMEVFGSFSDKVVPVSIDEAYLDLTKCSRRFFDLHKLGEYIKNEVYKKTGLTCSIGISECRVTSKIASDFDKPNGCTVVNNQAGFLAPLDIKKIPGIGKKSINKYYEKGIKTIGDLARASVFKVMDIGGKHAVLYRKIARGEKRVELYEREARKSVSVEKTFSYNQLNREKILEVMEVMCEKVYRQVRGEKFKTVSIKVRDSDFRTITRDHSFSSGIVSLRKIKEAIKELFLKAYVDGSRVRLVGVKVSGFNSENGQRTLGDF